MKKIIRKFWGVALVVVLLSTLFVGTVPQVSAATLVYSTAGGPNPALSNQIAAADATIVKVAPNGDIFVIDTQGAADRLLKSVDGGYTWAAAAGLPAAAGDAIGDIAISPDYVNDGYVYAVANVAAAGPIAVVFQSTNAGASFLQFGSPIGAAGVEQGTSIALEPTFHSGVGQIMVGTAAIGLPTTGNVYIWGSVGLYWLPQTLAPNNLPAADYTAVAFSPAYPIDRTIFAVGSVAGGTTVNIKVFTNAWNAGGAFFPASTIGGAAITGFPAGILTSSLSFPADFNASSALTRTYYVGINAAAASDVYRVYLIPNVASVGTPLLYGGLGVAVNNLAYVGTTATGSLYAGAVATATYAYTLTPNIIVPLAAAWIPGGAVTGTANACVAVSPSFATDATIYVGTGGGLPGDESAFNVSTNAGLSFQQTGLIDTVLTAMLDFVPYSSTEWYLVTQSALANNSLWKTVDGGVTWARINLLVTTTFTAAVRLSPAFATDGTMYFFETGAIPAAPPVIAPLLMMSHNSGATWTQTYFDPLSTNVGVADVAVVDATTLYAGSAGAATVYKTTNNGYWWTAQPLLLAVGNVNQIKRDAATGHLLAGTTAGEVYRNALATPEGFAACGAAPGAANIVVAFDSDYANNSIIYAGENGLGGLAGIARFNAATPLVPWANISLLPAATACMGLLVAPDGVLYAADATGAAADNPLTPAVDETAGGVYRILAPTTGSALFPPVGEQVSATGDGLTLGNTLFSLAYAAGSNILYAIENVGVNKIVTYTDTLTTVTPGLASPTDLSIVGAPGFTVTVTPVAGAVAYQVMFDNRADFLTTPGAVATNILNQAIDNSLAVAGDTVYFRMRVSAPLLGPWSQTYSVVTQLVPVAPNAPVPAGPVGAGGTATGGYDAALQPTFQWGAVPGATAFEFVLAKDVAMTDKIIDATGANALGVVTAYKLTGATLEYSTTYYWQVRAISATSSTAWCNVQAFTTLDEPEETAPPVIIPTQTPAPTPTIILPTPTVTVNVPAPTQAPDKVVNPTYIWAIIIIGAVLVIAVIVLIVRTRRSV